MTKERNTQTKTPGSRIRDALNGLLDRVREEAEALAGALGTQRTPVLQPVPVRIPGVVVRRRRG